MFIRLHCKLILSLRVAAFSSSKAVFRVFCSTFFSVFLAMYRFTMLIHIGFI